MACGKYFKAYLVGGFSAIGGFLFGYHTGVISGVLTMENFRDKMNLSDNNSDIGEAASTSDARTGGIVAILLFGCIFGSLISGQTSDRFSRKYSISVFAFIFTISAAIQTWPTGYSMLLVGRFVAGEYIIQSSIIVEMMKICFIYL